MAKSGYAKPLPALHDLSGQFYNWTRKGELRFQRCNDCDAWRHVPREMCAECGSWDWQWEPSSGRGTLFTWTTIARPLHPAFAADAPYAVAVIEMEEGVRIVSRVADTPPDQLEIDMPVEVVFERVTPEVTLPLFRRARVAKGAS
ncbi:MAG: Zn-ribbon domain-containing OB-fold protein [Dehalococcoidia bacterium]